jgi:hypothetical protein
MPPRNNPIDSLSLEAQMNKRIDKIAGDCRIAHPFPYQQKPTQGTKSSSLSKATSSRKKFTYNYVLLSQHPIYKTTSNEKRIGTNISSR